MESSQSAFVLGQRYTWATVAVTLALLSFVNAAGLEKSVLAIVLAVKALSDGSAPPVGQRRGRARLAIGLAATHVVVLAAVILLNLHRLPELLAALRAFSDLR